MPGLETGNGEHVTEKSCHCGTRQASDPEQHTFKLVNFMYMHNFSGMLPPTVVLHEYAKVHTL